MYECKSIPMQPLSVVFIEEESKKGQGEAMT